jgi:hypothetical protein
MSKILVVSAPSDDHHETWVVDKKEMNHIYKIFGCNRWEELEDCEVEELGDSFVKKIGKRLGKEPTVLEDVYEYFKQIIADDSITLTQFSHDVVECINTDRGSWSSHVWVKTKGN